MASSGSFGEVAGPLTYNAFVSSPQTRTWTIVNNFNYSLGFYIIKPNLTDASINTSVTNGTIGAGKYYKINVTIVSHTTDTQSAYITAYAVSNGTNGGGGGSVIRLAVIKSIEINGTNITISNQAPPQNVTNQSNDTKNKIQGAQIAGSTTAASTTIQNTQNKSSATQSALSNSGAMEITGSSYIIVGVVVLLIVVCGLGYYFVKINKKSSTRKKGNPKRNKR